MWIDKATYQWAKVEGETTGTISWGLFLARLNPGASLVFEQAEVNSELWLPKRLFMSGSGRVGAIKRLEDQEIEWSNYKKFSVDSKMVTVPRSSRYLLLRKIKRNQCRQPGLILMGFGSRRRE